MEARPPVLIESVVCLLVPSVAREQVLGDLAERYVSPRQYLAEAVRTVPFVIVSQIRRTSYFVLWPLVTLMLTAGFGGGTTRAIGPALIPAVATLIGFMFRDAYRVPDLQRPRRKGLVDIAVAGAFAVASQVAVAITRPEWLIAPRGVFGGVLVLAVLYVLRLQNPSGRVPRSA